MYISVVFYYILLFQVYSFWSWFWLVCSFSDQMFHWCVIPTDFPAKGLMGIFCREMWTLRLLSAGEGHANCLYENRNPDCGAVGINLTEALLTRVESDLVRWPTARFLSDTCTKWRTPAAASHVWWHRRWTSRSPPRPSTTSQRSSLLWHHQSLKVRALPQLHHQRHSAQLLLAELGTCHHHPLQSVMVSGI